MYTNLKHCLLQPVIDQLSVALLLLQLFLQLSNTSLQSPPLLCNLRAKKRKEGEQRLNMAQVEILNTSGLLILLMTEVLLLGGLVIDLILQLVSLLLGLPLYSLCSRQLLHSNKQENAVS